MWEQIRANRSKTGFLVIGMLAVLAGLGFAIAEAYVPGGGMYGIGIAAGIWMVMSLVSYFQGDRILLAVSGAKKIEKADHPELFNVVEEMKIASGLSHMPEIYIIPDDSLNAFATGRKPERCAVAITSGLLAKLNRDELQGVMGHEVAHIVNRDVLLMSMVGVMLGAIVMISEFYLRSLFHTGRHSRRYGSSSSSRRGGGGSGPMVVVAIVLAILAPILAQLIYFAISRRREYLADASAAVFTRYPDGLASALEQLAGSGVPVRRANKATAAMYIVNPFAKSKLSALTSTHPPADERVRILRSMAGKVSYASYQRSWGAAGGGRRRMPSSALQNDTPVAARKADPRAAKSSPRDQAREAGDILRKMNGFLFLPCACGLRLKVPPEYRKNSISCPKCARTLAVPVAEMHAAEQILTQVHGGEGLPGGAAGGAMTGGAMAGLDGIRTATAAHAPDAPTPTPTGRKVMAAAPLRIEHTPGEWQSFKCTCGKTHTLSPGMLVDRMACNQCGREIDLVQP